MEMDSQHVILRDLEEIKGLSVRAYNVCRYSNLLNLNAILCYYQVYGCFIRLRNCGRKTDVELIRLCMNYEKLQEKQSSVVELAPNGSTPKRTYDISSEDIQLLSPQKVEIIEYFVSFQYSIVFASDFPLLSSYLKDDFSLNSIWQNIYQVDFKSADLRGIGRTNAEKVNVLFHEIYQFIRVVILEDDEVRLYERLLEMKKIFSVNRIENIASIHIRKYIGMAPNIALFKLMEDLISEQLIFSFREMDILNQQVGCSVDFCEETLDSIGKRYKLTRDRVRQIRKGAYRKMYQLFPLLKSVPSISAARYGIDGSAGYIPISDELVQQVNLLDGTRFNAQLIGKMFELVLSDSYSLLGCSMDGFFENKMKHCFQWTKQYLIDKRYTLIFDFTGMLAGLYGIIHTRRREVYHLNLKEYMAKYLLQGSALQLDEVFELVKHMALCEFNLSTNADDHIVFRANSQRLLSDCIYDLLLEVNQPSDLSWIERVIKQRYPKVKVGVATFYKTCKNDSRFILWGTGPIYGLRVWKDEANIKEGRMLSMVEEYLQAYNEPKHIDSITSYVCRYRNTNRRSLFNNLIQEKAGRFRLFGKSMIGLTAKEYPSFKQDHALSEQ